METLDTDLVLGPDGHLTDVGASVLADGQGALLPPAVARHADGCPACLALVGEAALLALEAHDALAPLDLASAAPAELAPTVAREAADPAPAAPPEPAPAAVLAAPLPWWAMLAAAALAVVGLGLSTSAPETLALVVSVARALPRLAVTLGAGLAAPEFSPVFERAALAGAATLWAAGMALGWMATRGRRDRQGERS